MKNSVHILIFFWLVSFLTFVHARDNDSCNNNEASTLESTYQKNLNISGYIDGSYNYLHRSNQFISGTYDRVYDLKENGFTLQQAALTIADQPKEGLGGLVNVIAGHDAFEIASYGMNPNVFDSNEVGLDLTQLYLQYAQGP